MLSVVIPTYNRPGTIVSSLRSVLQQTIKDIEIIVVDGSDNDITEKLIRDLNDDRVIYVKVNNQSAAYSRNIGLKLAIGDYISFNDDDDLWRSKKAEEQLSIFQKNKNIGIVYSAFTKNIKGKERVTPSKKNKKKDGQIFNNLLLQNFIGLPTLMARRNCFEGIFFDEKLYCLEDWDLILRLAKSYTFSFIGDALVKVGDTPQSVNKSNRLIKATAYKRIYHKFYDDIIENRNINAKHLLSIGSNLCLSKKLSKGRKYLIKSIRVNSRNPAAFASLIISFFGTKIYGIIFEIYEGVTGRRP